jgi:hypothetical protein
MRSRLVSAAAVFLVSLLLSSLLPSVALAFGLNDVLKMHRDGITDSLIVLKIENAGKVFHLDAEDLRRLKDAGVSDDVVAAMLNTERPRGPRYVSHPRGPYWPRYEFAPYPLYPVPYYPGVVFGFRFGYVGHSHGFRPWSPGPRRFRGR